MFCQHCGTEVIAMSEPCPKCGRQQPRAAAAELGKQLGASSRDAAHAVKTLVVDPVAGLGSAFDALGPTRARSAGLALCFAFALAAAFGVTLAARQSLEGLMELSSASGLELFFKALLGFLVLPAALAAAGYGIRRVLGGKESVAADIFTAGAALTPLGLTILASGLLGLGNFEVVLLLLLISWSYLVLMLYTGLTRLGGLSGRAGAPAVPVLLVVAAWLSKVVFAALA